MQTYAAYGHAVKTVTLLATRVAAQRGLGENVETLPIEQGLSQLAEANSTRGTVWEQALLLGDVDTITAARLWHESAWHLERFARGLETGADAWASAMKEANDARAMFYAAARGDLGVPGTPPATTWPWGKHPLPGPVIPPHNTQACVSSAISVVSHGRIAITGVRELTRRSD
ncbi:MAG TPA: hypothetical protein DGT23_07090 [Micromonosporaceae bacterium]|nr:hypothetical protein [Micromonosporaceae bacterium]